MRRTLSVILALLPAPALAALPAVTITRTLSAPDGTRPASGTIRATLGPVAATYSGDGQTTVVSGSVVGTVSAGVATITLAPNDVLTPSGTIYAVSVSSDKPRLSWSETWSVASSGAVTRIGVAPGVTLPPTVVYGLDAALSGAACSAPAIASDTGRIYGCAAGRYVAASIYAGAADLAAHAARTDNPHAVTYAQTGALGATAQATDAARLGGQTPDYYAAASALAAYVPASSVGAASGVASLGSDGKVPAGQLPASGGSGWQVVGTAYGSVDASDTASVTTLIPAVDGGTFTIAAGTIAAGTRLRITAVGSIYSAGTSPLNVYLALNGTNVDTAAVTISAKPSRKAYRYTATLIFPSVGSAVTPILDSVFETGTGTTNAMVRAYTAIGNVNDTGAVTVAFGGLPGAFGDKFTGYSVTLERLR